MNDDGLTAACHCLGLQSASDQTAVELAYRRMKALYENETPATYGLFDEDERRHLLEGIEAAYVLIRGSTKPSSRESEPLPNGDEPLPPLDESVSPAAYLRRAREIRGMTLQEIAERTKIGTRYLSMIEEEKYGMLPAPVYLRGFVFDHARTIGVPCPEEVARRYLDRCRRELEGGESSPPGP